MLKKEKETIGYYIPPEEEYTITYEIVLPKNQTHLSLIKLLGLMTNLQKMQEQRNMLNNITWKQSAKSRLWETLQEKQWSFFNK